MPSQLSTDASRSTTAQTPPDRTVSHRRWAFITAAAVGAVTLVAVGALTGRGASPSARSAGRDIVAPIGPEGIPLQTGTPLAPASTSVTGQTVDGIGCDSSEQVAYHVHTHLSIYVDRRLRPLPAGIGIVAPVPETTAAGAFYGASQCYYWLHVHAQDGVIHIESPTGGAFTLGQLFDIWGQPLQAGRVGPAHGALTVFVDGKRYAGDPRAIVLGSHLDIQIDVGPGPGPRSTDWSRSGL